MTGEVKPQETPTPGPSLSFWDILIWKLDSLDKRLDALDQGINRRMDQLEEHTDREFTALRGEIGGLRGGMKQLEERMDREFTALRGSMNRLEERTDREFTALRGEMGNLHQEFRSTRHSSVFLQLTTVIGFLAVLVSFWLAR